jgi:hypothetical protein
MWISRRPGRLAVALATPVLLAALAGAGLGPAQAAAAGCKSQAATQPINPGTLDQLVSTTVLSACDVWAVGSFINPDHVQQTLIEQWNGSKWAIIPSPNPGAKDNELFSVSAASPTSIWAVGQYDDSTLGSKALVLHWNGQAWSQQDVPNPGIDDRLDGVSAVSGGQAWVVGNFVVNGQGLHQILHFANGKWIQTQIPSNVPLHAQLTAVTATSAKDVWAIGGIGRPFPIGFVGTIVLHWNGQAWTRVPSPNPGLENNLIAVAGNSATNALIVGYLQPENGPAAIRSLALHWNGKAWTAVPSPSPANANIESVLKGVAFTGKNRARAVGDIAGGFGMRPLIAQWNGQRFALIKAPVTATALYGIAGSSATSQWTVGLKQTGGTNRAYAFHFVS